MESVLATPRGRTIGMRLAPFLALLLVLLGVVPGVAFAGVTAVAPGSATPAAAGPAHVEGAAGSAPADGSAGVGAPLQVDTDGAARTELHVNLHTDGDATWVVTMRYDLKTENETRAFESFSRRYEDGEAGVGMNAELFRHAAATASEAAGREMAIRNVTRSGDVANQTGVLRLEFVWTNFLSTRGDGTLRLEDAFRTADGSYWFSSLEPHQRLVVETPPGHTIDTNPGFPYLNDSVIIDGPRDFSTGSDQQLVLEYREIQNGTTPGQGGLPQDLLVGVGAVLALLLAVGGAFLLARRREDGAPGVDDDANGAGSPADTREPAAADESASVGVNGGEPATPDEAPGAAEEPDEADVDLDLLSDEERVEHLLEQSGGRMKQATIVKETGWSDAKVSQLLSSMADEGRVDKLRLGRENLISLPDGEDDTER